MSDKIQTREDWLLQILVRDKKWWSDWVSDHQKNYYRINRSASLSTLTSLSILRGLQSYFINDSLTGLKQNFYVASKLLMASQREPDSGLDAFAAYQPFLYGLLSDSPEIYEWLAHAELKNKDYIKGSHFRFHQFQLILREDDAALRETIALIAKKGGNRDRAEAVAGADFFSLLLKRDKEALQACIENAAKIKSVDEYIGQFLAGYAFVLAKLCWFRGINVEIKNPLVPMPLLPINPLTVYDVEYDFLRPGWIPPQPGLLEKAKRWFR